MKKFFSLFVAILFAGSMIADSYTLVSNAGTLADGDQIIIVDEDVTVGLSTTQNNNNRGAVSVSVSEGSITPAATVQVVTLEASSTNWKLKVGADQYLYAASNSNNYLKTNTSTTAGDNGVWSITIDAQGVATVVAQGTNARNNLRYNPNSGSPIFSCYASTSPNAKVKIFKKVPTICSNTVTITKGAETNGTYSLSATEVCGDGEGGSIVVSNIKPATGYRFSEITATNGTPDNENKVVTGITQNSTITVVFEAIPTHAIHFNTDGVAAIDDAIVAEGATYTITETPEAGLTENCEYNTFVGWTLASSIADPSVKPDLVSSVKMETADVTLYAVYSKTEGGTISSTGSKTFNFAEIAAANNWENGTAYTTIEDAPVTIEAQGEGNNGKFYTSDNTWRMYNGGTVEITVDGGFVTAVSSNPSVTFVIANGVASFSPSETYKFKSIAVDYSLGTPGSTTFSLSANCEPTAIDNAAVEGKAVKFIENGQLFIEKAGVRYNVMGQIIK